MHCLVQCCLDPLPTWYLQLYRNRVTFQLALGNLFDFPTPSIPAKSPSFLSMNAAVTFLFSVTLEDAASLVNTGLSTLHRAPLFVVNFHKHFFWKHSTLLSFLVFMRKLGRERLILFSLMRCPAPCLNVILYADCLWVLAF